MKLIRNIHLWLALPFCLVFMTICTTGALLIVERPVTEFFYPGYYDEPAAASATPAKEATGAKEAKHAQPKKIPFFANTLKLHRWLLDAPAKKGERTVGKTIVGVSVIMFVIDLLTGLVLWWPRTRKMLRARLKVTAKFGKRRFYYDAHVSLGFWVLVLLLIIALTGLTWSFPVWKDAVYAMLQTIVGEENVKKTVFALHTGTWAGAWSQVLYFACCIIGATLPATGIYMWWKKRQAKK
ncbi:MAG: PepSY-associated TM helix domain-containing protein [Bacteroidales bacterium]|nr:PepSY-associated TM helix domain-containing protein [Bacteroidales bacterium]